MGNNYWRAKYGCAWAPKINKCLIRCISSQKSHLSCGLTKTDFLLQLKGYYYMREELLISWCCLRNLNTSKSHWVIPFQPLPNLLAIKVPLVFTSCKMMDMGVCQCVCVCFSFWWIWYHVFAIRSNNVKCWDGHVVKLVKTQSWTEHIREH